MSESTPVLVRYYAGARAAAGVPEEQVSGAATVAELCALLAARHGAGLERVLSASALLVDGVAVRDRAMALPAPATVEVLPPFAGG